MINTIIGTISEIAITDMATIIIMQFPSMC